MAVNCTRCLWCNRKQAFSSYVFLHWPSLSKGIWNSSLDFRLVQTSQSTVPSVFRLGGSALSCVKPFNGSLASALLSTTCGHVVPTPRWIHDLPLTGSHLPWVMEREVRCKSCSGFLNSIVGFLLPQKTYTLGERDKKVRRRLTWNLLLSLIPAFPAQAPRELLSSPCVKHPVSFLLWSV